MYSPTASVSQSTRHPPWHNGESPAPNNNPITATLRRVALQYACAPAQQQPVESENAPEDELPRPAHTLLMCHLWITRTPDVSATVAPNPIRLQWKSRSTPSRYSRWWITEVDDLESSARNLKIWGVHTTTGILNTWGYENYLRIFCWHWSLWTCFQQFQDLRRNAEEGSAW